MSVAQCLEVTAKKLCSDYAANEVRADGIYRGQTIVVTGYLDSIDKDLFDNINLHLRTQSKCPFGILAPMPDRQSSSISELDVGNKVTLRCKGAGMLLGSPNVNECVLVEYWQ